MTLEELAALRSAVEALEHPSFAARLSNLAGKPVELMRQSLPAGASEAITKATMQGLNAALSAALRSMRNDYRAGSPWLHKALVAGSGALGGGFGLLAMPLELPVSTVLMLRGILDVARGQGEDLAKPETPLSALQVFALGGEGPENGYFAVRGMLAKSLTEAARFIAERGLVAEGAPVLVRFMAQIGSRFGIIVSQKFAAQALPMIGALGGAAVNYAFMHHFQDVADAHFLVRRLERIYGQEEVRAQYERLRAETAFAA
jgi:hypothetical protein